jgi:hypothetical protein
MNTARLASGTCANLPSTISSGSSFAEGRFPENGGPTVASRFYPSTSASSEFLPQKMEPHLLDQFWNFSPHFW